MKTMKYSRQREMIYETVMNNRTHPTAEFVYNCLKKDNPQLSLGTVYRNLQRLAETGDILKLSIPDRPDRYDGNIEHHYHMMCENCGEVFDVFIDYFKNIDKIAEDKTGCKITSHNIMFKTICQECSDKSIRLK